MSIEIGGVGAERLTHQETKKLATQARKGNIQARNRLIESSTGLIFLVIKRYFHEYVCPKEDLFGYGVLGLIEAIDRFDPQKGSFSTCAVWWIRQAITREVIQNEFSVMRFPENKTYGEGKTKGPVSTSLSEPLFPWSCGAGKTVGDFIASSHKGFEEEIFHTEALGFLKKRISHLEYNLLRNKFCFDTTLKSLGKGLGISKGGTGKKIQTLVKRIKGILTRAGINSAHC